MGGDIDHDRNELCALMFYLESKFFRNYEYMYFCSKCLITVGNQFLLIPDPLKIVSKFGRHDLVNADHVEEYRISCMDLFSVFSNAAINGPLSVALCERYSAPQRDFSLVFSTLYNMTHNRTSFHSMFYSLPGDVPWTDPSRPSLDI